MFSIPPTATPTPRKRREFFPGPRPPQNELGFPFQTVPRAHLPPQHNWEITFYQGEIRIQQCILISDIYHFKTFKSIYYLFPHPLSLLSPGQHLVGVRNLAITNREAVVPLSFGLGEPPHPSHSKVPGGQRLHQPSASPP